MKHFSIDLIRHRQSDTSYLLQNNSKDLPHKLPRSRTSGQSNAK